MSVELSSKIGPALLQLHPLCSWGCARLKAEDLMGWKRKFCAFLIRSLHAKRNAAMSSQTGALV